MKYLSRLSLFISIAYLLIFLSCSKETIMDYNNLAELPADTGGIHQAFPYESTLATYGYYIYTPSAYENVIDASYPLMVFLHGSGEKGNSSTDTSILDKVLRNGPPKLIEKKKWKPSYPMIVASPQCHDGGWNAKKLHEFIEYLVNNYRINTKRIYITGLSMGGGGTFNYVANMDSLSYAAAIVPICGWGNPPKASAFLNTPTWAFHGEDDTKVKPSGSINMINAINELNPPVKAKLTLYPKVGHNSWSKTYDDSGMGTENPDFDPFNQSIYDWLFQFEKIN